MFRRDPLANPDALIRRVYAYVAYRIGHGPDAEDVTSTVFENAVRYRDTYDPAKAEPVAWLLGIARRAIAQALEARPPATVELGDEGGLVEFEAATVERLALTAALNTLGERDRELLALRYGADLRARQIADVAGMTTNAVEVALHRAHEKLREALKAQEEQHNPRPILDPTEKSV